LVDGISSLPPKIKSFDDNLLDDSILPDSEPTDNRIYGAVHTLAVTCRLCKVRILVEVTTKVFHLEPYVVKDEKIAHPTDPDTLCDALERVLSEVRHQDRGDPNDFEQIRSNYMQSPF
jgi:hypothetical protein